MRAAITRWTLSVVLALTIVPASIAQVPQQINFQGRLTDSLGVAVPDGPYMINFKIYASPSGDDSLWWSGFQSIEVQKGLFQYQLGSTNPFPPDLFGPGSEPFLGITVDAGPEGVPRTPLVSVAFSLYAGLAGAATIADFAGDAGHAIHADTAGFTSESDHAIFSDTAGFAHVAAVAAEAIVSEHADTADYAHTGPAGGLSLPYSNTLNTPGPAFAVGNQGAASGTAIYGASDEDDGVVGWSSTSAKSGVYGYNATGSGVSGRSEGDGHGVYGETGSLDTLFGGVKGINLGGGAGVLGEGSVAGLKGIAAGGGSAVVGINTDGATAGDFYGDLRVNEGEITGHALDGEAARLSTDQLTVADSAVLAVEYTGPLPGGTRAPIGIWSNCSTPVGIGIGGYFQGGHLGISGAVVDPDSSSVGVEGWVHAFGSHGPATAMVGVWGSAWSDGQSSNTGVYATANGGVTNIAVEAVAADFIGTTDRAYAVKAVAQGYLLGGLESCYGVYSVASTSDTSYGLNTYATADSICYGVYSEARYAARNYGIFAKAPTGMFDWAGYFDGDVSITGILVGGTPVTRIDHPLDPANKYLDHSAVGSPEMTNVYSGNVVTGEAGRATVVLPGYFEALNTDFRYQLTVIGEFAQAIIAEEIHDNQFVIRTDKPGVKVSWSVTGVRHDAAALARQLPVEVDKPETERGAYLNPRAFGAAEEQGVSYRLHGSEEAERERDRAELEAAGQRRERR